MKLSIFFVLVKIFSKSKQISLPQKHITFIHTKALRSKFQKYGGTSLPEAMRLIYALGSIIQRLSWDWSPLSRAQCVARERLNYCCQEMFLHQTLVVTHMVYWRPDEFYYLFCYGDDFLEICADLILLGSNFRYWTIFTH